MSDKAFAAWPDVFKRRIALIVIAFACLLLAFVSFTSSITLGARLDEQFLFAFARAQVQAGLFLQTMVNWSGPRPEDSWGILACALLTLLAQLPATLLPLIRILGIIVHAANGILLYIVARDTLDGGKSLLLREHGSLVAACAALIFVSYPLAPETVSYLGGIAYLVGCTFLLSSFGLYLRGKLLRNWALLGLSWIAFLLAMLADTSLWSAGSIVFILELARAFLGADHDRIRSESDLPIADFEDKIDLMLTQAETAYKRTHGELEDEGKERDPEMNVEEGTRSPQNKSPELDGPGVILDSFVPSLIFVILGALVPIGALPVLNNERLPSHFIASQADWIRVLKHFFFPINETLIEGYLSHYQWFYLLYAIPAIPVVLAFVRNRFFRQNIVYLGLWLLVIIVPHLKHALSDSSLSGSRWAYTAVLPIASVIAMGFFAPAFACEKWRWADKKWCVSLFSFLGLTLTLLLVTSNVEHSRLQCRFYEESVQILHSIQTGVESVGRREKSDFVFARNIPACVSIAAVVSPHNVIVFDTETGLARAYQVPGGRLEDKLRKGMYENITTSWVGDKNCLIPAVPHRSNEGTTGGDSLIPEIRVVSAKPLDPSARYAQLCYNYPDWPDLGLISIDRKGEPARLHYDVSMIAGSDRAVAEWFLPGRFNPDGADSSRPFLHKISLPARAGNFDLGERDFKYDGLYSVRVFAVGKDGMPFGNASDEIDCLVYTR